MSGGETDAARAWHRQHNSLSAFATLLDGWLAVPDIRQQLWGGQPPVWYHVDGDVKADGIEAGAGTPAREVRAALIERAEDGLEALARTGWLLTEYPRMEIVGELYPATVTLLGEVVQPPVQVRSALRVRFAVTWQPG